MEHYLALDALRGVAALSILLFHLDHWWGIPWLATNAYLAVDFFFCLSGFVLALAYAKDKYRTLGLGRFAAVRLVRLMPLVILANVISAAYLLTKGLATHAAVPLPDLARAFALGVISVPDLSAPAAIGGPQVFPLNGPQYTLFLELLVNLAWFATQRLPQLPFALIVSAFSFALLGHFGLGGDTAATILLGIPRVCGSFFAGVALFHATRRWRRLALSPRVFAVLAASMLVLFFLPRSFGLAAVLVWSAVAVPLLVLAGASVVVPVRLKAPCAALGALSYPIYALHYPVFCWINGIMQAGLHRQDARAEAPVVILGVIAVSALALATYDTPVRRALGRLLRRGDDRKSKPAAARPVIAAQS